MSSQRGNRVAAVVAPLASVGRRAVAIPMRPVATVTVAAAHASMDLQRRALERMLDSPELDRLMITAINSEPAQDAINRLLESEAAKQLVASLFEAGLFDQLVDRLLTSEALWRLIDEIAVSPAVTAAITQQGLGFADQFGEQVRTRSRDVDDWLERAARRLVHRRAADSVSPPQEPAPGAPQEPAPGAP